MWESNRLTKTFWAALLGFGLSVAAAAQTYEVLKAFNTPGLSPAGLIQGADGNLYGTTVGGGANGSGTIFKIDANGITTLHSFAAFDGPNPQAGLIQGSDGNLYGTTAGSGYGGTIFKLDTSGSTFTTLHTFGGGDGTNQYAALIQGTDGSLYGTTYRGGASNQGTIFKIETNGSTFTTLHNFGGSDGQLPYAGLIQGTDGNLYGTTESGGASGLGTIFKMDTNGSTLTTLHIFGGSDGQFPDAGLTQATDGNLYGTTESGGATDGGTIFKIDTNGTTLTTLHSFAVSERPQAGLIQGADGDLYGTVAFGGAGQGTIFKIDTNGTVFTTLHSFAGGDGAHPQAGLIQAADGSLLGTTAAGGANGYGTIFKIDTNGSTLTTLYSLAPSPDGAHPRAGLIQGTDGNLYGTTDSDGTANLGTIFKIDTNGTTLTPLHSFAGGDRAHPLASLMQAADGNLYGTTVYGGGGKGTIFKIDTNGSTLTTLHSFAGYPSDPAYPYAGLIQGTDGDLYGTTSGGGANNSFGGCDRFGGCGAIFKIDTNGTALTMLYSFADGEGVHPETGLVQGADGSLYGTTGLGGVGSTIFKIDTTGSTFSTLHSFASGEGVSPTGLILGTDGNLYGTTDVGGTTYQGTIFKVDTSGATFTTLYSFVGNDGANPTGLIQGTDGGLYGSTRNGGANGYGTIFRLDTSGSTFMTLHSFALTDGALPFAAPFQATDGFLYGTAYAGGPSGAGVVFKIFPSCFFDVPPTDPFFTFICTVAADGITAGCGEGNYCPQDPVTRAQMAVFLLKAEHGPTYTPPACTGIFADVPCTPTVGFSDWIERLYNESITGGCFTDPLRYCPDREVRRDEMAALLLKTEHGATYVPPACAGIFDDVPCTPTVGFSDWIERLANEGVTGGCFTDPLRYCPDRLNSRGEMAVFLVKTFGLQ